MMVAMRRLLDTHDLVLMEAAVVERLRRGGRVELHPTLAHAPLIYDHAGRRALEEIYRSYIAVARTANLPLLLCTPTWRANHERLHVSAIRRDVNNDAVGFLRSLQEAAAASGPAMRIGGLIGCRNDCYRPEEGLAADEAEEFHAWQVRRLAGAGVDFLIAETLPNVHEATGIARAMAGTGVPYIISFAIDREGRLLDQTPLPQAVSLLDAVDPAPAIGYMVNCSHPSFLNAPRQPPDLFSRLVGYKGNASSLDQTELDGQNEIQVDDVATWGDEMLRLNRRYGVKVLGGCCGTGVEHLRYIVDHWEPAGR
jgi:S-methylmethionine-dependent homocysteine/selenocysteine methylase